MILLEADIIVVFKYRRGVRKSFFLLLYVDHILMASSTKDETMLRRSEIVLFRFTHFNVAKSILRIGIHDCLSLNVFLACFNLALNDITLNLSFRFY